MTAWIIAIIAGALIGYIGSLVMRTNNQQGAFANIIIGIVGAALGRWIFGDILHFGTAASAGSFSLMGLVWGVVGAVALIAVLKMFHVLGTDGRDSSNL
jgi:uncharacterized membrane protein YeaQ/YmgE (transglycosylase-associated protein family)